MREGKRETVSLVYALLLRLLPPRLKSRAAAEMLETFRERQREARSAGYGALVRVWAGEFAGLLVVAVRARGRDHWEARLDRTLASDGQSAAGGHGRARKASLMDNLKQDLGFAVRSWARRPGVNLLAVVTIALGVGASSAMFSVVDTVLLRPLPYRDPGRIVTVYPTIPEWRGQPSLDDSWERGAFSYPEFVEWSGAQRSFEQTAAVARGMATILAGDGVPERLQIGLATSDLFPMLGVEAAVGRTFAADDDPDTPAVLLSHGLWQRRFGGDESVVGRTVRLDDVAYTIVGVLPHDFIFPARESDVWQLIARPYDEHNRDSHRFSVIARLAPGVTRAHAQTETNALLRGMSPPDHTQHGARIWPHLDEVTRHVRAPLWLLVGASWLLLLIACVNVGTLLLGAGIDREGELSLRAAIGAGRRRIASQLLTESLALAAVGGAGGVLLARAATRLLTLLAPAGIPRIDQVTLDARVAAFAVAISALSGVLFGLVPALALSRTAPGRALYAARVGGQRRRLQSGLVVAQMALATLLLAAAGLLTRNMAALNTVDPGFDPENLLTVQVALPYERFASGEEDPAEVDRAIGGWFDEILTELRSIPGVEAVAVTSSLPHSDDRANSLVEPEGYLPVNGEEALAERRHVSWNYLDVMRMRLLEGRTLVEADDRADADPVAVVGEDLARRFWPGESAIGKHLGVWEWRFRIVGVVAETRELDLAGDPDPKYYAPGRITGSGFGHIVIRTTADPSRLAQAVRQRIWSVDDELAITGVMPMTARMRDSLAEQRYRMRLMIVFAALAGCFALLGIHGVTSRSVARRTHEMGIRMALGSPRRRVLSLVLGEGLRLVAIGAGIGLIGSFLATRVLERFLYPAGRNDSLVLAAVVLGIGLLGLIASAGPARRAVRMSPMIALRADSR